MSRRANFTNSAGLPEDQVEAITSENPHEDLAKLARSRNTGTHVFRSERRQSTEGSVGMHWTTNPDALFGHTDDDSIIWHGIITDPESVYSPQHSMMKNYKYAPSDWEGEVRFVPGSRVQVKGMWRTNAQVPKGERVFDPGWPSHSGYTYEPINKEIPVENKGFIDYPEEYLNTNFNDRRSS
jgi:hypothetical protein